MANPGQIDHVTARLADIPEKLRGERIQRYLGVYLSEINDLESVAQAVINAFFLWETTGKRFDFILEIIGALLDQERPDGFSNDQYSFILQARVRVREQLGPSQGASSATQKDVQRVAKFLSQGCPVQVFRLVPKIIIVVFCDLVLTPQEQSLYFDLLLDTVDAVDKLSVQYVTNATAFYDFDPYDEGLYA